MLRTHALRADRSAEIITLFEDSVVEVRHLAPGARFTLGEGAADLPYADMGEVFDVVRHRTGGGIEIVDEIGMHVELVGHESALAWTRELVDGDATRERRVALLPSGARARIALGHVTILVEDADAPRRHPLDPRLDMGAHASTGVAALICLLGVLFMSSLPPSSRSLEIDPFLLSSRYARFDFSPPVTPPPKPSSGGGAAASPAKRTPSPSGRPRFAQSSTKPPAGSSARSANPDAAQAAQTAASTYGLLGVMRGLESTHGGSLFGAGSALGDAQNVMGEIQGSPIGDSLDAGGLGIMGSGRGPSGIGAGAIGVGRLSTGNCLGKNCGDGSGRGPGHGAGKLIGHKAGGPEWTMEPPKVSPQMDKDLVRRVVRQHANEIKYCYEQRLQQNAALSGRVVTRFVITVDGRVTTAGTESSTMSSPAVESCIAQVFRRMEFPHMPPGAGIAIVSYPFTFHKSGE